MSITYTIGHPVTGNYGHSGRPGMIGGSGSGGGLSSNQPFKSAGGKTLANGKTVFKEYDGFKNHAHDQAAIWEENDSYEYEGEDAPASNVEDTYLRDFYSDRAKGKTDYEQIRQDESSGSLQDVFYDFFDANDQ